MKVYLVNLDRDTDRLASIDGQLKKLGIEYERISAVYGKNLSKDEIAKCYNSFRWWCAMGWCASAGEIGCALSHFKIYERMMQEDIDAACIIEDDVLLSTLFAAGLEKVEGFINAAKAQVILLSDHTDIYKGSHNGDEFEIIRSKRGMCTDGYCLTKMAAKALLLQNEPIIVPCDMWKRWSDKKIIELYHLLPSVCRQEMTFGSYTTIGRVAVDTLSPVGKIIYKAKRLVGKALDIGLQIATGR